MRLLNTQDFVFKQFANLKDRPAYAILSHRWADYEPTQYDIEHDHVDSRIDHVDHGKIYGLAEYIRTRLPHIGWILVDSCCIKQESAAELSEGVNCMFDWYRDADVCIAYLADVRHPADRGAFRRSVWFKRGWTLQELIASTVVIFVTRDWEVIGHKGSVGHLEDRFKTGPNLEATISGVTSVPLAVLQEYSNSHTLGVEERMRWMEGRETLKEEDMYYALFGIFGVTPGANYGEKKDGAKQRLLEAIARKNSYKQPDLPNTPTEDHIQDRASGSRQREGQTVAKRNLPKNVIRYITRHLINGDESGWTVLSDFEDGEAASFIAAFPYDSTTKMYLTLPSPHGDARADWVVTAPNADYYPGRHEGHLIFPSDFPFEQPLVWWDTPILSPYPRSGQFSGNLGEVWSSRPRTLLNLIETMACMILRNPQDAAVPSLPGHFALRPLPKIVAGSPDFILPQIDEPWLRRCTQFFCRVYNRIDSDHSSSPDAFRRDDPAMTEQITNHHREISIQAVNSFVLHILVSLCQKEGPFRIEGMSVDEYFVKVQTLKDWHDAERKWADMLNERSDWLVSQGRGTERKLFTSYYM